MSATQFFPLSPEMFALACETVSRRVSRLPFLRSGVMVTGELLGVAMECLNAEFNKTLTLRTPSNTAEKPQDGLDRCIEERLKIPGKTAVPVIADVLCTAGIAETVEISDRFSHRTQNGIRLMSPWTWHAASAMTPLVRLQGSGNDDPLSWMSMCPVCRTGILNRVVGKQLFGIPHTDFYMECTHCGAKYIPVGTQFRLVSIAHVRDPLWRKNLDQTFSAETWSAIAQGTRPGGNPLVKAPSIKPPTPNPISSVRGIARMKDGSLSVPSGEKTLYFKPVTLNFSGGLKENIFTRAQTPLQEILKNPAFSHLVSPVNARYSRCLPLKSGIFLGQLKERHDPFYREFLHDYGDEKFGSFRLAEADVAEKRGVLMVAVNLSVFAVVNCKDSFGAEINNFFGRISPEDCLLNGESTCCRINALLSINRKDAGIYIHKNEHDDERQRIIELAKGDIPRD